MRSATTVKRNQITMISTDKDEIKKEEKPEQEMIAMILLDSTSIKGGKKKYIIT